MIDRDKKLRLLLIILSVIILFPETSFAHLFLSGLVDGFAGVSLLIIPFANLLKFLIIVEFKGRNDYGSLASSIFYVSAFEIFLVFLDHFVISTFLSIFYTKQIYEMYKIHIYFLFNIFFWVIAIAPNVFLVKEKKQKFFETISVQKNIIFAAMLAFITPSIGTALFLLSLVSPP